MGLVTALTARRVYLDTNVFVYALGGFPAYVPLLVDLFDALDSGSFSAVPGLSVLLLRDGAAS